jgi:hypothetical protein
MKIFRKVIPKIARDIVRALLSAQAIDVEDGRQDEVELDIAGVIVDYLNTIDGLHKDALEALNRHQLPLDTLGRVKKSLAETRGIIIGERALEWLLNQIIAVLFRSRSVEEVYAEDHELRSILNDTVSKYLGVDEELDKEVRGRLKHFREGTNEWEIEYGRLIGQMRLSRTGSH